MQLGIRSANNCVVAYPFIKTKKLQNKWLATSFMVLTFPPSPWWRGQRQGTETARNTVDEDIQDNHPHILSTVLNRSLLILLSGVAYIDDEVFEFRFIKVLPYNCSDMKDIFFEDSFSKNSYR